MSLFKLSSFFRLDHHRLLWHCWLSHWPVQLCRAGSCKTHLAAAIDVNEKYLSPAFSTKRRVARPGLELECCILSPYRTGSGRQEVCLTLTCRFFCRCWRLQLCTCTGPWSKCSRQAAVDELTNACLARKKIFILLPAVRWAEVAQTVKLDGSSIIQDPPNGTVAIWCLLRQSQRGRITHGFRCEVKHWCSAWLLIYFIIHLFISPVEKFLCPPADLQ